MARFPDKTINMLFSVKQVVYKMVFLQHFDHKKGRKSSLIISGMTDTYSVTVYMLYMYIFLFQTILNSLESTKQII